MILPDILAMEPESAAMRQGDEAWVDLVNWMFSALLTAELEGVTRANVDAMKADLVAGLVVLVMAIYCLFVRAHTRAIRLVLVAIAAALFLTWYDRTITPIGTIDLPALKGFNIRGGWRITPEFGALALALTLYGGAYIAEIVRNGLITVPRSQMDAARALALSPWATFWTVRLPLALRTIVPPLGNQYVFLMKATTVGVVIGFNDLFMVTTTAIVQSGQTIEVFALMILCFLCINYTIITIMGTINKALKIEGYEDDQ
jgi:ABC-type amino acid transport system permease subunit